MKYNAEEMNRRMVVLMPKGMDRRDLEGLLMGFSRATDKGAFYVEQMPSAYGEVGGCLLLPTEHVLTVQTEWVRQNTVDGGTLKAKLELWGLTPQQASSMMKTR